MNDQDRFCDWRSHPASSTRAAYRSPRWTLQKGERYAVALVRQWRSAPGYELRISINDELRWAHVYRSATELQYEADAKHRQFGDRGWRSSRVGLTSRGDAEPLRLSAAPDPIHFVISRLSCRRRRRRALSRFVLIHQHTRPLCLRRVFLGGNLHGDERQQPPDPRDNCVITRGFVFSRHEAGSTDTHHGDRRFGPGRQGEDVARVDQLRPSGSG